MATEKDSYDDLWELAEFYVREGLVLRSFLEYLKVGTDPLATKLAKIQNWRKEVGLQLGSPEVLDRSESLFEKARALPPPLRRLANQAALAEAHSRYFDEQS